MMNMNKPRGEMVLILLLLTFALAAAGLSSCRSSSSKGTDMAAGADPAYMGGGAPLRELEITASLLLDREEIEKRFKTYLPDSGIVPVEITMRNNTSAPVWLRATNGFPLPGIYSGFMLEHGDKRFPLLSPYEVLQVMMKGGRSLEYRKPGVFDAVVGVAFPPALFYYGYKEVVVGRYYRAVFKHSLYPPRPSGILEPVELLPGEEAHGFLYFFVRPEESPYPTQDNGLDRVAAGPGSIPYILVQPTGQLEHTPDLLEVRDLVSARIERPTGRSLPNAGEGRTVFGLGRAGKWQLGDVLAADLDALLLDGGESAAAVASYASKKGRIVDASSCGERAACAIDFKSSSKVAVVEARAGGFYSRTYEFGRRCLRVICLDEGFIVLLSDGECRYTRYGNELPSRTVRVGTDSQDLLFDGDRLVLLGKKSVSSLGASGDDILKRHERRPLDEAKRRMIGRDRDIFYVIHEAGKVGGDTIAVYDASSFERRWRMPLPGKVVFSDLERGLLLQIEDGTVVRFARAAGADSLSIDRVDFMPVEVGAISFRGDGFIALGTDGATAESGQIPSALDGLMQRIAVLPKGVRATADPPRSGR